MELNDKVIVMTGGAHGIGRAMLRRFAAERPRALVVTDVDLAGAEEAARYSAGAAERSASARVGWSACASASG